MKTRAILAAIFLLLAGPGWGHGHAYQSLDLAGGAKLEFALVLPEGFDPSATYPVLLALPPGAQNRAMVEAGLSRYWGDAAGARGWIVVSPIAPGGVMFFLGSEKFIPPLLDAIQKRFHIEGGKFHLAGVSNGGRSAFRVALDFPDRFHSLTVLPGFPPTAHDEARLERLRGMPVHMFAGGADRQWAAAERATKKRLDTLGIKASVEVFPGEGHIPRSMTAGRFMDLIGRLRTR